MQAEWQFAIDGSEVEEEDVMPAEVDGREIAIYRVKGAVFASDDLCTHGAAHLSEGIVIGETIECPLHQGRFCVRTGKPKSTPVSEPIKTYPCREEDGKIYIRLNEGET